MAKDDRDGEQDREDELDDEELAFDEGPPRGLTFLSGFVLGALLGAGAALLLAPERGQVVRRRIRTQFDHMRDDAADRLTDWRDDARRELRRQRRRLKKRLPH